MRTQTHPSHAVKASGANIPAALPQHIEYSDLLPNRSAAGTRPFLSNKQALSLVLSYLTPIQCPLTGSITRADLGLASRDALLDAGAQIDLLAKTARNDLTSPLVRLPALCEAFGLARSTALRKIARKELPQRVRFHNSRISAYRKVDIEMTLAAQTLAARHGYMLNMASFIAAISAPFDTTAQTN